jgi:peroxiredoxin
MDDTALEARLKTAWAEVSDFWARLQRGEAARAEDPQPRLAAELFAYFLNNRDTPAGRKALRTAFTMWGNTPSSDAVAGALTHLDTGADYWGTVLHGVSNAYARTGRADEIEPLLQHYEKMLTHPQSKNSLFLLLGGRYLRQGDATRATRYYEAIIALGVSRHAVQEAEGALYEITSLAIGQPAPVFEAVTIDGETVRLAELPGRVVCLEFWATDCGPCWTELPALRALHADCPRSDLQLIGISSDRDESELRSVMAREQLTWPQIREEVGWTEDQIVFGPLRKLYNVWGEPTAVVIDRDGRIAARNLRGDQLGSAVRGIINRT